MGAPRRPRSLLDLAVDVGIVAGVLLIGSVGEAASRSQASLALVLVAAPLFLRRRWPLGVLLVVAGVTVGVSVHLSGPAAPIAAVAVASFTVGDQARDRSGSALSVLVVSVLMPLGFLAQDANVTESIVLPFVILVPAWLAGDVVRARRQEATERAASAAARLRESEERLRDAVAEERRHMARELHDVIAHGVSVMLIQAGAARQVLATSPGQATEALLNVEAAGREAMTELRRMLGVLNEGGEAAGLTPQPGIGQLAELVDRVREAGLPAELTIDGDPRPLAPGLDVTAYRIVQEALTNALRYAARARTLIHLSFEPGQLRLEVLDDGPGSMAGPAGDGQGGTGRGLSGLGERAAEVGGRLEAGPRLGGGFAVRAWLPTEPERP